MSEKERLNPVSLLHSLDETGLRTTWNKNTNVCE
jgi:hypothetical protein